MRIVDQLHGLDGKLSHANANILNTLLHTPNLQLWNSAKNVIIGSQPIMTLGKAVKCVKPATGENNDLPDSFTLYRAMRYCLSKQKAFKNRSYFYDIEP